MPATGEPSPLPRYLAIAYALLIVHACLHPFTGWRDSGLPLFDYLSAPFPQYYRLEDLVLNVLGYVPLGFVLVPALPLRKAAAILTATLLAALLSFSVETAQHFLPTRISSNVDLACNTGGAFIGALFGALWGRRLFDRNGWLHRWRLRRIIPGRAGDLGLILAGLWLLAQLMPDAMLFESGDLRGFLDLPALMPFEPERFMLLESVLVATSMIGVGLFARCAMRAVSPWPILLLLTLAVGAKSLAGYAFFVPGTPLAWFTPGALDGLLAGAVLLGLALLLPPVPQHALAGMSLLLATTLANLIPDNPYLAQELRLLGAGNFLNFHGLTQLTAAAWPVLALAYLSAIGLWRGDHLHRRPADGTL